MTRSRATVLISALILIPLAHAQTDEEGSKDYPGISRMPGFYISGYKEAEFDAFAFPVSQKNERVEQQVEGRFVKISYDRTENAAPVSKLQIIRNLQNAARAAGGSVVFEQSEDPGLWETTLRLTRSGSEIWVYIGARDNMYEQTVVARKAMQQEVTMDAGAMGDALSETGRVAVYGIYFDTAKSDLKPESEPMLAEIAKLLQQKPALKLLIVGHTDMVGDTTANVKLSQARAQSVVSALTAKYGISAARLVPYGAGPYAPVASNKTEEGRAKNRRVELVEFAAR